MKYLGLKNEFSLTWSVLQLKVFKQDFSLKSDFSRRHLCQNPPALAGGSLSTEREKIDLLVSLVYYL